MNTTTLLLLKDIRNIRISRHYMIQTSKINKYLKKKKDVKRDRYAFQKDFGNIVIQISHSAI